MEWSQILGEQAEKHRDLIREYVSSIRSLPEGEFSSLYKDAINMTCFRKPEYPPEEMHERVIGIMVRIPARLGGIAEKYLDAVSKMIFRINTEKEADVEIILHEAQHEIDEIDGLEPSKRSASASFFFYQTITGMRRRLKRPKVYADN